jgi:hypothetical protein
MGYGTNAYAAALQPDGRLVMAGIVRPSGTTYPTAIALVRFLQSAPQIGSLTASPNPVTSGAGVTLTASGIADDNPSATVANVEFDYFDPSGNKVALGTGTQITPGVWALSFNLLLPPGTYTLYARASDNYGAIGDPTALSLQVT